MSRVQLAILSAIVAMAALPSRSFAVTNAVVGTCKTGTQFTTIQAAVKAATAGSTVQVCPGVYPEQVAIGTNLTLKGVTSGTSASVTITQPAGGLLPNAVSGLFGTLAVQLYVRATNVTISGIAVDGTLPSTAAACSSNSARWVGIMYQGGGGTLTGSSVLNTGCPGGISVFTDATPNAMSITNNVILNCGVSCIEVDYADTTTVTTAITGNTISVSPGNAVAQIGNTLGVEIQYAAGTLKVLNNFISDVGMGVLIENSQGVAVTGNTVAECQAGIVLGLVTASTVQSNHIAGALYGVYLQDANGSGGNTITKNTILNSQIGLDLLTPSGDVIAPNTYGNVQQTHN